MPKTKKLIHIHAKCDAFEIFEVVPENEAVNRLIGIRNNFIYCNERGVSTDQKKQNKLRRRRGTGYLISHKDHLIVKTRVVNPELQFH